jgi:hypothetical protein
MRDFKIDDIPSRTGWDELRARLKTALGWVFLLSLSAGIGALIALTTFPR